MIEEQLPVAFRAKLRIGVQHEYHRPAQIAQGARRRVDRPDNIARTRHFSRTSRRAERLLHVDDDERGLLRIERVEPVQLARPGDDTIDDFRPDGVFVHDLAARVRGFATCLKLKASVRQLPQQAAALIAARSSPIESTRPIS
jgi:hypothetical protein